MKKLVPIAVFLVLIIASGVIHGLRTERWAVGQDLDEAARRVADLPQEFGDWRGNVLSLEKTDLKRAGIKGYQFCRFQNDRTREVFNVLLVCGRSGPISIHTPDVCYEGAGYRAIGTERLRDIPMDDSSSHKFMGLEFRKPNSVSSSTLEVLWAWNGGDGWTATTNARLVYAHYPVLYKLYIIREIPPGEKENPDAYASFLRSFLPKLNEALYPKPVS